MACVKRSTIIVCTIITFVRQFVAESWDKENKKRSHRERIIQHTCIFLRYALEILCLLSQSPLQSPILIIKHTTRRSTDSEHQIILDTTDHFRNRSPFGTPRHSTIRTHFLPAFPPTITQPWIASELDRQSRVTAMSALTGFLSSRYYAFGRTREKAVRMQKVAEFSSIAQNTQMKKHITILRIHYITTINRWYINLYNKYYITTVILIFYSNIIWLL